MDIVLALGGGGARGFAHIGVLRKLETYGFRIKAVAGTSAGGIIACMYAAGFSPSEMEYRFSRVNQSKLLSFFSVQGPGLLGLDSAEKYLLDLLGNKRFSDLHLPCAVVAVDIRNGHEVVLDKGSLVDAIMATTAVPGIFAPRKFDDMELVDGGVLNPVPVAVARSLLPRHPIVAVSLSQPIDRPHQLIRLPLPAVIPQTVIRRLAHLRVTQAMNIFMRSIDIGQRMITQLRLEFDNPDVVIRPAVGEIGLLDIVDIHKVICLGEEAAEQNILQIINSFSLLRRIKRILLQKRTRNLTSGYKG